MGKRAIAFLTLLSFLYFNYACTLYTTKKELAEKYSGGKGQSLVILGVITKSGEEVKFSKDQPGKILNDRVFGNVEKAPVRAIEFPSEGIQNVFQSGSTITDIITKDGKAFHILSSEKRGDVITGTVYEYEKVIPLSECEMVWVKKVDPVGTFFAVLGGIAVVALVAVAIIALTKESCPFIYSFDGKEYVFDAEPYGGATCQGLKRTEWCGLQYLKDVNGEYKIRITNEVDETQHTDELKLVVVDHPAGTKAIADETGKIHTIANPQIPFRAYDGKNRDILPKVVANDWIYWITRTDEKNPDRKGELKDELTFEFPKPVGVPQAKLYFNGCNTLWASQMVKRYLDLWGKEVTKSYEALNTPGPAYSMLAQWNEREELYRLQIRVETENGWKSKGTIVGGGPFVSEDKVYILDVADVPGDTLKIKLNPPAAFWMINYLAVDYTPDLPLQTQEVEAAKAADYTGKDLLAILSKTDNDYFVMPYIGDSAELLFKAPPKNRSLDRSIFLKASGYYDIHLEAKGECQKEILNRFLAEPGFAVQYAFQEYLKWQKENMERLRR